MFTKKVELDLASEEAQDGILLLPEQRKQIEKSLTQHLKTEWDDFFDKYKAQSVDIFNVEEVFKRKCPETSTSRFRGIYMN